MCYDKPGPRCSGHTRTNYRKTKAAFEAAEKDVAEKKDAMDAAATAEAKAELQNSERLLAVAKKAHTIASKNYEESKAKREVAMKAYNKAKEEYATSPEGIKQLRKQGNNAKADECQAKRKEQMQAFKAKKAQAESEERKQLIGSYNQGVSFRDKQKLANADNTHPVILECIVAENSLLLSAEVASNPHTPDKLLKTLASNKENLVRERVARNPSTSVSILRKLAKDKNLSVQREVASNPRTPESVLTKMSASGDTKVAVAENPALSPEFLAKLAQDNPYQHWRKPTGYAAWDAPRWYTNRQEVMTSVASNPNTPEAVLRGLVKDPDTSIRCSAVRNPSMPSDVLEQQERRGKHEVQRAIQKRREQEALSA